MICSALAAPGSNRQHSTCSIESLSSFRSSRPRMLYAVVGAGLHPCHWCKRPVGWTADLEVDHLDDDRANNTPANLAPSCHACNAGRACRQRWQRHRCNSAKGSTT